jgi:hypothetical protein
VLRDDSDARVLIVNSEVEAVTCYPLRQPDTDHFRYWEVAGTAHISAQELDSRGKALQADVGMAMPIDLTGVNTVPLGPVVDAAYRAMQGWLEDGIPPPVQPRIEFGGDPAAVLRDENGIARGGIRLPQVEVPLAVNSGLAGDNLVGWLGGSSVPFSKDKILALYGDLDTFSKQFQVAALAAVESGVLLPRDAAALIAEARETFERQTG